MEELPTDKQSEVLQTEVTLSWEQQFAVASFNTNVDQMSAEQAREMLKDVHKNMIIREVTYQHLLKKQWGLDNSIES